MYIISKTIDEKDPDFKDITREKIVKNERALRVWARLESDHFVKYHSSWYERVDIQSHKRLVLYIQMDLCWFSLREAMVRIAKHFDVNDKQLLPTLGYYMASELFKEVLTSIAFLHNLAIIHRDIKPENMLIRGRPGAMFLQLADFGLAVMNGGPGSRTHSSNVGTHGYIAPEVLITGKYGINADLFSIGIMIQELFHFDINK